MSEVRTGTPPAIVLEGVTRVYPSGREPVHALRRIDLSFCAGEFVSIVGASGSGKSTLLNVIGGLDRPTDGEVLVRGHRLRGMSDDALSDLRLRWLGFVFQSFQLFPSFTVRENVSWRAELAGQTPSASADAANRMLDAVGIARAARDRRPAELSGGEQQRVAIARALVTAPEILLADEPTGNLDSRTGTQVLDLLRALNRSHQLTVVLVTHSAFAATYGHRTIELSDGSVLRDVRAPVASGLVVPLREA